jgi:outer membrane protein TolC
MILILKLLFASKRFKMLFFTNRVTNGHLVTVGLALLFAPLTQAEHAVVMSAVQQALRTHHALAAADARLGQARMHHAQLKRFMLPSLSLSADYTLSHGGPQFELPLAQLLNPVYATLNQQRIDQGHQALFPTLHNQTLDLQPSRYQRTLLTLSQPLVAPQAQLAAAIAQQQLALERVLQQATILHLTTQVRHSYYRWIEARLVCCALEAGVQEAREALRVAHHLVAAGMMTPDGEAGVNAALLELLASLQGAQGAEQVARLNYNRLTNESCDATPIFVPADELWEALSPLSLSPQQLIDSAGSARPDIVALRIGVVMAQQGVRLQRAAGAPTLGVGLQGGIVGQEYGLDEQYRTGTVSTQFEWVMVDGLRRSARRAEAQAQVREARELLADAELELALQVRSALVALEVACAALPLARDGAQAATLRYKAVLRRYEAGQAPVHELIAAASAQRTALVGVAVAQCRLLLCRVDVDAARGRV